MTKKVFWFAIAVVLLMGFSLPNVEYAKLGAEGDLSFPRDHFAHADFRTEWWYFNGFLGEANEPEYAFHLAFFVRRTDADLLLNWLPIRWFANPVHLAHFSLVNLQSGETITEQKRNRDHKHILGKAGASEDSILVWNEDWLYQEDQGQISIEVSGPKFDLSLQLQDTKPLVLHGDAGAFVKAKYDGELRGSYYTSRPRLSGTSVLNIGEKQKHAKSQVWMDHEFGSFHLAPNQSGWSWFSLMFEDNSELVLYLLKNLDGSLSQHSIGTWISSEGKSHSLSYDEIKATPSKYWQSAATGARYPVSWQLEIKPLNLQINTSALIENLEFDSAKSTRITYWEGPVAFTGLKAGLPIAGLGFQELTGNETPLTELSH